MNRGANLYRRKNHSDRRAYPDFLTSARTPCGWPSVRDLFVRNDDRGQNRDRRVAQAKAVCLTCPFRAECDQWATETRQLGIWGGRTHEERVSAYRKGKPKAVWQGKKRADVA